MHYSNSVSICSLKRQAEIVKLGELLTSKGFCSNEEAHAVAKLRHHPAIAVSCVFLTAPLQGSQRRSKPYLDTVKPCRGGRERKFLSLDHCGLYKLLRSTWAEIVKISITVQWKHWVVFVFCLPERKVSGRFPSTFCGSGIKRHS